MERTVVELLINNFRVYFSEDSYFPQIQENTQLARKILEIFNISQDEDGDYLFNGEIIEVPKLPTAKIIPYPDIDYSDIIYIEEILNDCENWMVVSPLFDCIGWVVSNRPGKVKLEFIGSYLETSWLDPLEDEDPTDYWVDIEEEDLDWKTGDCWPDGYNLETMEKPYWKNLDDEYFDFQ